MAEVRPDSSTTFYSGSTLGTAFHLAEHGRRAEELCQAPILIAALAVEAFVNDLEFELKQRRGKTQEIGGLLGDIEHQHAGIRLKLQVLHMVLSGSRLDKGSQPYQDYDLFVDLRNSLVHAGPISVDWSKAGDQRDHRFIRPFIAKKLIAEPDLERPAPWRELVLCPNVARWSCNTALRTIRFTIGLLPDSSHSWVWAHIRPVRRASHDLGGPLSPEQTPTGAEPMSVSCLTFRACQAGAEPTRHHYS